MIITGSNFNMLHTIEMLKNISSCTFSLIFDCSGLSRTNTRVVSQVTDLVSVFPTRFYWAKLAFFTWYK